MDDTETIRISENDAGGRLDFVLAGLLAGSFSRSQIKKLIEQERILLDHKKTKANYIVKVGDEITVCPGDTFEQHLEEENIPLEIIYEDEDVLVVNKPAGLVVHPGAGNQEHTLVHGLLYHTNHSLSSGTAKFRPGIVHRIDKETSGLLVVAKNNVAHEKLAAQFKDHSIDRRYWVMVRGVVEHDELQCDQSLARSPLNRKKIIVDPVGGKESMSHFFVLERFRNATLLDVALETGRTHQIRVHLKHLGYPVLGDSVYGIQSSEMSRQALHAKTLAFDHPTSGKRLKFDSEVPGDFQHLLNYLREKNLD
jgi:23S rRNA pseudouridine1911/1915/1917 synthase